MPHPDLSGPALTIALALSAVGSAYAVVTILMLWFAGASAMAGLLNLVPRYLPRFGTAPRWVARARPLVLVLFGIAGVITLAFADNVAARPDGVVIAAAFILAILVLGAVSRTRPIAFVHDVRPLIFLMSE